MPSTSDAHVSMLGLNRPTPVGRRLNLAYMLMSWGGTFRKGGTDVEYEVTEPGAAFHPLGGTQ